MNDIKNAIKTLTSILNQAEERLNSKTGHLKLFTSNEKKTEKKCEDILED
jgi:hypothetical protein